jgi:hypothetical protein
LRDRERVESRAPLYLRPRTYLEPFALRALGIVRQDQDLLAQANARFDAFGLEWHRAQTDVLVRV